MEGSGGSRLRGGGATGRLPSPVPDDHQGTDTMWRNRLALLLCASPAFAQAGVGQNPFSGRPTDGVGSGRWSTLWWADFDGDGAPDFVQLHPAGAARLLRNAGGGHFEDVTEEAGLGGILGARQALWADFDGDGRLDLFLTVPGGTSRLLAGSRGPRFEERGAESGLGSLAGVAHAELVDSDGDGAADLWLAGPGGERLLRNVGGLRFEELALAGPGWAGGERTISPLPAPEVGAAPGPFGTGGVPAGRPASGPQPGPSLSGFGVGPQQPAQGSLLCALSIDDAANPGVCLLASSVPTLGLLYPISNDWFVSPQGRVGLGTLVPIERLHVEGRIRATGQIVSTAVGQPPFILSSNQRVANLNADLLDGLDSLAFRQTSQPIVSDDLASGAVTNPKLATAAVTGIKIASGAVDSARILDGSILDVDVAALAAIAGTKIAASFGSQNVTTTGRAGVGTTTPNSILHVAGPAGDDALRVQVNGATKLLVGSGGGVAVGANVLTPPQNGLYVAGDVGLGTAAPSSKLHVVASGGAAAAVYASSPSGVNYSGWFVASDTNGTGVWGQATGSGESTGVFGLSQGVGGRGVQGHASASGLGYGVYGSTSSAQGYAGYFTGGRSHFGGNVGVGTLTPLAELHVAGVSGNADLLLKRNDATHGFNLGVNTGPKLFIARTDGTTYNDCLTIDGPTGNVGIGTTNPQARLDVQGATRTTILTITGGADLAERFEVHAAEGAEPVEPGMLVVIDAERPGELRVSQRAYDRRVAGVISGAKGLSPGLVLSAEGNPLADGRHPVALTGRVWCRVDTAGGAIQAGDLLTTSDVPGHAMKVSDHARAFGAVVGKAMTSLAEGERGLVLVLVNLQ